MSRQSQRQRGSGVSSLLLLALLCLTAVSCASTGLHDGEYRDAQVRYTLGAPGPGWAPLSVEDANAAWIQTDTQATLLVNAHCQGVDDAPLEALSRHLVFGMTERKVSHQERLMISRREALETELTAKLDGVPRKLKMLVLKKDGCVYDVVLASPPEAFQRALPAYRQVKAGLDIKPRPSADGEGT